MKQYRKFIKSKKSGFSLTELMVAIAIIVILMLLFLPALWPNLERAKKMQCRSNLRQMGIACFLHAKDQEDHSLGGATYNNGPVNGNGDGPGGWSDNLNFLFPNYIDSAVGRSVFVCPSSDNIIMDERMTWTHQDIHGVRTTRSGLKDLWRQSGYSKKRHAKQQGAPVPEAIRGVSYEINNYFSWKVRKTANVGYFQHIKNAFNLEGVRVSPDEIYLIFDGDANGYGGRPPHAHNNFPDDWDNHGRDGVNMLMCDGSVKWVDGGRDYMFAYELSQDEDRGPNRMPNLPPEPVVD